MAISETTSGTVGSVTTTTLHPFNGLFPRQPG